MIRRRDGFTMVELLVVIAITSILLTLIAVPLIQSFNLSRTAEGFANAQDKARQLVERISREINNAGGVRNNSGIGGSVAIIVPSRLPNAFEQVMLEYAKLDIVKPAEGEPLRGPSGALINPNTGMEDPTLRAPKGQMQLPATPGNTIVRYFIGLRNPVSPVPTAAARYLNPYDNILMRRGVGQDNLFVLWRAEVQPMVWDANLGRYVVNAKYFATDPIGQPILDDPWFFNQDRDVAGAVLAVGSAPYIAKTAMVQNWVRASTIVTEVSRYDMIQPIFERKSRRVTYDGNVPRIMPLIQFKPTSVGNETAEGQSAVRLSEEGENMAANGPDVYETKYPAWSKVLVRIWPNNYASGTPYLVGRPQNVPNDQRFGIHFYDPTVGPTELTGGTLLFDTTSYSEVVKAKLPYPFSRSVAPVMTNLQRSEFVAFVPSYNSGKLVAAFGIDEVGDTSVNVFRPDRNLPQPSTGPALTPTNDTALGGTLTDPIYSPSNTAYEINKAFNKAWVDRTDVRPNIHRFVDLRVMRNADGTLSPLDPDPATGFARAKIVPGSEVVTGPDQRPGLNYGQLVRYTRSTQTPGPNQYRINYVNQAEPDYALLGFGGAELAGFNPNVYDPTNFISAHIQPRYKAGYLQFHSDPNTPLPQGNISVFYRFQFTGAKDVVAVDYDTRKIISLLLTVRNYAQGGALNAQQVTVKGSANARNILR